jgi:hypothetical protein
VGTPDESGGADTRGKRSIRTAQCSKVRKRRKLEHHRNHTLANKNGPSNYVASPASTRNRFTAPTPHAANTMPPDHINPGMQPNLSEISDNNLEETWDETWCPAALDRSKSVSMPRYFDTIHHLSPRTAFTGHGTVIPGHRPPATVAHQRKSLPSPSNPIPHRRSGFGRMKKDYSAITEVTSVYHISNFVWDSLTPEERVALRSAALPFEAYDIWRSQVHRFPPAGADGPYLCTPLDRQSAQEMAAPFSVSILSMAI